MSRKQGEAGQEPESRPTTSKEEQKTEKKPVTRFAYTVPQVALVILAALVISLIFNTSSLYRWAERMDIGWPRQLFLFTLGPLHEFCTEYSFTEPYQQLRSRFRALAGLHTDVGWLSPKELMPTPVPRPAPGVTEPPPQPELYSDENPLDVLVIGDSMVADSIAPVFRKTVQENVAISPQHKAQYSSGLSRPDFYNWPLQAGELLSLKKYDLVIVMLGMNDAQDIREGDKVYDYGTAEWFSLYTGRVRNFVTQLLTRSRQLYWLGMPTMQLTNYSRRMARLNDIYSAVCASVSGATFISTRDILDEKKDTYTHSLRLENKVVRVRISDGKHFTAAGGELVITEVMKHLKEDFSFRNYPRSYIFYGWY